MLDDLYYVTKGLMVEFQGLTAIKKRQFEQQYDHYFLIQYSICAADEARQGHLLLVFANIEEMLRALPHREKTLWWDAWGHMGCMGAHGIQGPGLNLFCLHRRAAGLVPCPDDLSRD